MQVREITLYIEDGINPILVVEAAMDAIDDAEIEGLIGTGTFHRDDDIDALPEEE